MSQAIAADATRAAFYEHMLAFNAHDTERVLNGMHDEVVWATGVDVFRGRASLADLFDDWLWSLAPRLDIVRLIVEGSAVAAECIERLVIEGRTEVFHIAVIMTVEDRLVTTVKVFREGTADIA